MGSTLKARKKVCYLTLSEALQAIQPYGPTPENRFKYTLLP
jgi:hypothetical protein